MNDELATLRGLMRQVKLPHLFVVLSPFLAGPASAADVDVSKLPPPAPKQINFTEDIQPILENSCIRCHGAERPKGKFSLINQDSALRGGANGVVIVPGDSANSPLIHYVARLVEDMEMPPAGKGEPLTSDEVALLRAWIDQGAAWGTMENAAQVKPAFSVAPSMRYSHVSGNKSKFREHFWTKHGWNPGIENFEFREKVGEESTVSVSGYAFPLDEDFRVTISYDAPEVLFLRGGFDHYRKYFSDSGGFYPFPQPIYALDRDLRLDIGRVWAEFGLLAPEIPRITIGYEMQFKEGAKSTLQWGAVRTTSAPLLPDVSLQRDIYPAFKEIDEKVHIVKLDVGHEGAPFSWGESFRAEFSDLQTSRVNALSITQGQASPTRSVLVAETHDEVRLINTLRLEKEIREWWFVAGGYLYSGADADAGFKQATVHATGIPISGDFWNSQSIVLKQSAHVLSANMRLGPWEDLVLSAGVQSEWLSQQGVGRVSLDSGNPAIFMLIEPVTFDANLDKHVVQENVALRFTKIPYTSLFAEARLEQEGVGQFEEQVGGDHEFLRDTDAKSHLYDYRVGFYTSPSRLVSLGAHYRQRNKESDYDHNRDFSPSFHEGYPAFIRSRTIDTDEVEAKATVRPLNWLKATFTYQWLETDYDTDTEAISGITPGGALRAGTFNANVYGVNMKLTPFARWYFSGMFNYYDSRMVSSRNDVPSVVPYRGNIYTAQASVTYAINDKTDVNASYNFSRADYAQNNFEQGLPLGISYDWHTAQAGITRRFKNVAANLQYAFSTYGEPTAGGFNDYTAHAIFATMSLRWR